MYIALENGETISAESQHPFEASGELVFTADENYEEHITDPTYYNQGLLFSDTFGKSDIDSSKFESDTVQPSFIVCKEATDDFVEFCSHDNVPVLEVANTDEVVETVTTSGECIAGVADTIDKAKNLCNSFEWEESFHKNVTYDFVEEYETDGPNLTVIDCGIKASILEKLRNKNFNITVIPYEEASVSAIKYFKPDLLFISNGPGSPEHYTYLEDVIDFFFMKIPLSGVGLGHQIIANSLRGSVTRNDIHSKKKIKDVENGETITRSINSSYTVTSTGPFEVSHTLGDQIQGLVSKEFGVKTVQFYPKSGFYDTLWSMANGFREQEERYAYDGQ